MYESENNTIRVQILIVCNLQKADWNRNKIWMLNKSFMLKKLTSLYLPFEPECIRSS